MISMKGETASERNSRPSLPSHDKIRYEILSSHGIEGKIIIDRISIINRHPEEIFLLFSSRD